MKLKQCQYMKRHVCTVRAKALSYDRDGVHAECVTCKYRRTAR